MAFYLKYYKISQYALDLNSWEGSYKTQNYNILYGPPAVLYNFPEKIKSIQNRL